MSELKRVLIFCILFLSASHIYSQTKQIPLTDFFKNPEKAGYTISPDGKYLAFTSPFEKRMNIFVQETGNNMPVRITSFTDRSISQYFWKDGMIMYFKDNGGDENFHLFKADVKGNNTKELTPFDKVTVRLTDDLENDPANILVEMNKENPQMFDVYKLNVRTGELSIAAKNPGNISGWLTDQNGAVRIAVATDGVNNTLMYREKEADEFKPVVTTNFKESLSPILFTFDNKYIYAASNIGRDKSAIVKYDPANGQEMEVIYSDPEVDVTDLFYSNKRKVITAVGVEKAKRELVYFDKASEERYKKIKNQLPGYEISFSSRDKNEEKFIIRTYSDRSLGSYYFYDSKKELLAKLADVSPWINENDMAEMKPVKYTSRDGLTIHGYLTLPKGKDPKNLPVVINPHGGPWARDSWGYNPEVQFLANRGYAVLQMNFRGSTGYGRKFWESSFKQWGLKMQDDITDGVKYLISEGIADPNRIAIYGGSYGGYATLAGITFTPELYAAAIDYVGVSNLFTFMNTIPPYWKPYMDMFHEMVGDPKEDSLMMRNSSPVFSADKIRVPLFVAQGKNDPRVNIDESDQMVKALKDRGVEVEYMVKDNEGHGFHNEENRFDFYGEMETFLAKHLNKAN